MLLPRQKPSSSDSLSKFVYVTSQLRHSLVVHHFLRKILDRSLLCATHMLSCPYCSAHRIQEMIESKKVELFRGKEADIALFLQVARIRNIRKIFSVRLHGKLVDYSSR